MSTYSLSETITESFYAWELRGRGWQCAPYPVALEPPHRPFFLLPELAGTPQAPIDDGKQPTLLSALLEGAKRLLAGITRPEPDAVEPFIEQEPFPATLEPAPVTFLLHVPPEWKANPERTRQLLLALSSAMQPISLEFVGYHGAVALQIVCHEVDREMVTATLAGHMPEVVLIPDGDLLKACWSDTRERIVIDFGLSHEFFLPLGELRASSPDPYIPLVSALARAGTNEFAGVQVLFERVLNPWERTTLTALSDGDGGCLFADAPEFLPLAREKTAAPLFAVILRIATQAESRARAWELAQGTQGFFLQFAQPGQNELIPLANEGYPDDLHASAFLTRQSYRTGMLLSLRELAGLVHIPDASVTHPALVRLETQSKAPPSETLGHQLVLGTNVHHGVSTPVSLSTESRLVHMHVIGASGTGKSSFLLSLILQDIDHGEGLAVLDPHGDLTLDILARIPEERRQDVILFDPSDDAWPIGFNIFQASNEQERTLLASDLVATFERLSTSWGDTMNTVLGNAVLAILESTEGGTLLDLRRFLVDGSFRTKYLATIPDQEIHFFWEQEFPLIGTRSIGPILSRLDSFLRAKLIRHIVGQKEGRLNLGTIMSEGKILLAKLSLGMMGEENASLLGSLLVSKFHQHALARQAIPQSARRPFFLYADECQHFVTPSLAALHGEGRKYALGLTLAHQTLSQLDHVPQVAAAVLGNAYTRVVFRVGGNDARQLAEGFSFFSREDIERLGRGQAIVRVGGAGNDFNLVTTPIPVVSANTAEERTAAVIALSRARYGTPLAELKEHFARRHLEKEEPAPQRVAPVLPQKVEETVEPVAPRRAQEVVRQRSTTTRRAPAPDIAPMGRGGAEHKYLQHLVKRLAEERGFRAVIEEQVSGGQVDVALYRDKTAVAVEVSMTTDHEHELGNVRKCVADSRFTHVLCVVKKVQVRERLIGALGGEEGRIPVLVVDPESLPATIDELFPPIIPKETTVKGYAVKVKRSNAPSEGVDGRTAVAEVIAKAIRKRLL